MWSNWGRVLVAGAIFLVIAIGMNLVITGPRERHIAKRLQAKGAAAGFVYWGPTWVEEFDAARMMERVESVSFSGNPVVIREVITDLDSLVGLESLEVNDFQITDADLQYLKVLATLKQLDLSNTRVTDAGLPHLQGLRNLESLNLLSTSVSDVGLQHLAQLTKLRSLDLENTLTTEGGRSSLRRALPNCTIVPDP
ncbi:MAG: hypothetical protein JSS49_19865 [Planctomycetes bacterium]|nr:hypothetical protein [Planctomycetota bacterium]